MQLRLVLAIVQSINHHRQRKFVNRKPDAGECGAMVVRPRYYGRASCG